MTHSKFFAFDAATGLVKRDVGAAALTADGYVGDQWDQGAAALTSAICVVNLESVAVGGGDEVYDFIIVGSNVADRSDGEILAMQRVGAEAAIDEENRDAAAGDRIEIRFRTEKNEMKFQYVDLYLDVTGAAASVGFNAYISKEFG